MRLPRLARSPLLHFAIGGSVLFQLVQWHSSGSTDELLPKREPLTITAEQVDRAIQKFAGRHGAPPDDRQRRALISKIAEEEILYREALYLGLDRGDPSVARRLLHKYRLVAEQPDQPAETLLEEAKELGLHENDVIIRRILAQRVRLLLQRDPAATITDDEIAALVAHLDENLVDPPTVSFSHVYLGEGEAARRRLAEARASLDSAPPTAERVEAVSMPFPLGLALKAQTRERVAGRFGVGFSETVFSLEPGRWHGPVESVYGEHLVQITDRQSERPKSSDELKQRALRDISVNRSARRFRKSLDWLRTLYRLRVEGEEIDFMTGSKPGQGARS